MRADSAGPTILVVDDEADVRESIIDLLQASLDGVGILAAASAEEGLGLLGTRRIDVVVADYRLPGVDGLEFLQAASRTAPAAARILVTGHADLEVPESALAGVQAVVLKPLDALSFLAHVQSALRAAQAAPGAQASRAPSAQGPDAPALRRPARPAPRTERARG